MNTSLWLFNLKIVSILWVRKWEAKMAEEAIDSGSKGDTDHGPGGQSGSTEP